MTMTTRVLIAEDSEIVRDLVRWFLERRPDIEICAETANGRQAVDRALELAPDLMIIDVVMPELNGIEVASIVKKSLPNTKMILFTMYGDYVKDLASAAGVNVVLAKPDGLSGLAQAVNSLMN
jgi:DNA-binding NarL/FixJ family response regulator